MRKRCILQNVASPPELSAELEIGRAAAYGRNAVPVTQWLKPDQPMVALHILGGTNVWSLPWPRNDRAMRNIYIWLQSLRKESDSRSLVLLDEVGTGTDPTEGAALGIALLQSLVQGGLGGAAFTMATTHHGYASNPSWIL